MTREIATKQSEAQLGASDGQFAAATAKASKAQPELRQSGKRRGRGVKGRAQVPAVDLAALPKMKLSDLHVLWHAHFGAGPPSGGSSCAAWRTAFRPSTDGGMDAATRRMLQKAMRSATAKDPQERSLVPQDGDAPRPGSSYAGPHAARTIAPGIPHCPGVAGAYLEVTVVEGGHTFRYRDRTYTSLSILAFEYQVRNGPSPASWGWCPRQKCFRGAKPGWPPRARGWGWGGVGRHNRAVRCAGVHPQIRRGGVGASLQLSGCSAGSGPGLHQESEAPGVGGHSDRLRRWWVCRRFRRTARPPTAARRRQSGRVDVVLVYKVDRLSRSLTDFARLMQLFDEHGCPSSR